MPGKALTLITQLPEFRHLCFAQRRPAAEEDGHALVATVTRILELRAVECRQFRGQVLNHGGKASGHYDAPAPGPNSTPTLLSLSPNPLRIFARKLCMTPSAPRFCRPGAMAREVKAKRG